MRKIVIQSTETCDRATPIASAAVYMMSTHILQPLYVPTRRSPHLFSPQLPRRYRPETGRKALLAKMRGIGSGRAHVDLL